MSTELDQMDERLAKLLEENSTVDDEEIIPSEELESSEAAWQDYKAGRDSGEPLSKVRREMLGHEWLASRHSTASSSLPLKSSH